jgi:flotillin
MNALVAIGGVVGLAAIVVLLAIQRLIRICQPNEVLIFTGSRRRMGNRNVGYRLVQGGRGVRIPLLEEVHSMDLTNMVIDIRVHGAYSKGGIPLNVEGVANVKVASEEPTIGNAIERFLGRQRQEIIRVAKETLEGNLRGVLATLTPEEVNHDRVKFAQSLLHEAEVDLKRLGLALDTLKIQNVSDDKGYLDSLGRRQSADLQMRSRVAEAENKAVSAEFAAKNQERQDLAKVEAEFAMAKAELERRILNATTQKDALIAEERSKVNVLSAQANAELAVQRARAEQTRLQLFADRIKPAEARAQAMEAEAKGEAAKILEQGKATAQSLQAMAQTWQQAGAAARQIMLAQKLAPLLEDMMQTVSRAPVEKVTFLDARLQQGGNVAFSAATTAEQLKHALGIDVPALLSALSSGKKAAPAPAPKPAAKPPDGP